MARVRLTRLLCVLGRLGLWGTAVALVLPASIAAATIDRDWTIENSIGVRYFALYDSAVGSPPGWIRAPSAGKSPVVVSPDGRYFFFVTLRGNLETDEIEYEMSVYSVAALERSLRESRAHRGKVVLPAHVLKFSSGYADDFDSAGIGEARWNTSTSIVFVGSKGRSGHRLYVFDASTGTLKELSGSSHDLVTGIGWNAVRNDGRVYATREAVPWKPLDQYPMAPIRSDSLSQLFEPYRYVYSWWGVYGHGEPHLLVRQEQGTGLYGPWISPDGIWALAVLAPKDLPTPSAWLEYERAPTIGYRYMLMNLEYGTSRPIFDAPAGIAVVSGTGQRPSFNAFWSNDSRRVVLTNTTLPLVADQPERSHMSYVVDYELDQDKWSILEPLVQQDGTRITGARWLSENEEFVLPRENKVTGKTDAVVYRYLAGEWRRFTSQKITPPVRLSPPRLAGGISVSMHEGPNTPPMLVASKGSDEIPLIPPDRAVQGAWLSAPQEIVVKDSEGRIARGALLLPKVDKVAAGAKAPLVIQAIDGAYDNRSFRPDGQFVSAFAAQALVAQGFAVLNLEFVPSEDDTRFTPKEGSVRSEWVDAAVDMLSKRGVIDPKRLGIVGFSRSGYLTYYILTHPGRTHFAAAIVFDSITAGYGEYVTQRALGSTGASSYEEQYGSGSFWQNKSGWMDAPAFNVDRVSTPVLFAATGAGAIWGAFETIGAFRYNGRPFEYLYFSQGSHVLQKPRERQTAMQANLDWMNFWLRDLENPNASSDQLTHWRKLKAEWILSGVGVTPPKAPIS